MYNTQNFEIKSRDLKISVAKYKTFLLFAIYIGDLGLRFEAKGFISNFRLLYIYIYIFNPTFFLNVFIYIYIYKLYIYIYK